MSRKKHLINNDNDDLKNDIDYNSEELDESLDGDEDSNSSTSSSTSKSNVCIETALKNITTANTLKDQISKIPLSVDQKNYFDTEIVPLLSTLEILSRVSYNMGTSSLSLSNIRLSKNSKIEDAIKLVYDVNKTAREVYDVLKDRIEFLIDIGCR